MSDTRFREILTPRLRVRRFRPEDATALSHYRSDPEVARYQAWDACSQAEAEAFIASLARLHPGAPGAWFQFAFELRDENVVGVRLPRLERIECEIADYSLLARPAWVDLLVDRLKQVAEERTKLLVLDERTRILEKQVRRVTQRVNLFEQILITLLAAHLVR